MPSWVDSAFDIALSGPIRTRRRQGPAGYPLLFSPPFRSGASQLAHTGLE